jgi:hypothetical protein
MEEHIFQIRLVFGSASILAGYEAMKLQGARRLIFWLVCGLFASVALFWPFLAGLYAPATAAVISIATSYQTWVILVALGLVSVAVSPMKKVPPVAAGTVGDPPPDISTPELRQVLEDQIVTLNNSINARLLALEGALKDTASPRSAGTFADSETRKMAGRLNYLVEYARRGRFEFPPSYTITEGMYYNDIMNSTHMIWTEELPRKLRRDFASAMEKAARSYGRGIGMAIPAPEIEALEKVGAELIAVLKG